jgi:type III secretion system chaperone SycN
MSDQPLARSLEEFGRSLGISGLALSPDRPVQLHIRGMGALFIEAAGDAGDALIYLAREFPRHARGETARRALLLCRPEADWPFTIRAGLSKENVLFFLAEIPRGEFDARTPETVIPLLSSLLDQALGGA